MNYYESNDLTSFGIEIKACSTLERNYCKTNDEINSLLQKLSIDYYILFDQIDLKNKSLYGTRPIVTRIKFQETLLINLNKEIFEIS